MFKQKTAYEMRISDWSSDVCSSDLNRFHLGDLLARVAHQMRLGGLPGRLLHAQVELFATQRGEFFFERLRVFTAQALHIFDVLHYMIVRLTKLRSEEHTSELQSLMRTSYSAFCLKTKNLTRLTINTYIKSYAS